jgi:hypothetical protein
MPQQYRHLCLRRVDQFLRMGLAQTHCDTTQL